MEVDPPAGVWEKLSLELDSINDDNRLAARLDETAVYPPGSAWNNIKRVLYGESIPVTSITRKPIFTLKRLAAAAIVLGLIAASYFLFINNQAEPSLAKSEVANPTIVPEKKNTAPVINDSDERITSVENNKSTPVAVTQVYEPNRNRIPKPRRENDNSIVPAQPAQQDVYDGSIARLEEKTFNQSLDDLSLVSAQTGYFTMVSADGRLVKIPAKYSSYAAYLQDKTDEPDYLIDFLFEEGAYWKDKFKEWRLKLAESSITPSYDNFFNVINLLNSIEEN